VFTIYWIDFIDSQQKNVQILVP